MDSLFVREGGGAHTAVPEPRWAPCTHTHTHTHPVIILLTRSEIDEALCILPPGGNFDMLINTSVSAHTHTHTHTQILMPTPLARPPSAVTQQQQMQDRGSIHHTLSLSQCAK